MASFTNQTKNTATFTGLSKNSTEFSTEDAFLLQEMGDYLLQENGDKIDISYGQDKTDTTFTNQNKH